MSENNGFSSRQARPSCTNRQFYDFITDLRNFGSLLPPSAAQGWEATKESCRFNAVPLGEVKMKILSSEPCNKVIFEGNVLVSNTFHLKVITTGNDNDNAVVNMIMDADLNPVMKMMAAGPIERFLETLVCEMEKFDGWTGHK